MYPSLPKYVRSSAQQQQMPTPSQHQHKFSGNGANASHTFSSTMQTVPYALPISSGAFASQYSNLPKSYGASGVTVQRSHSAANTDMCRTYWGHNHASTMLYRSDRHHSKRKSAVELLAESKQYFVKSDMVIDRSNYGGNTLLMASGKRGRNANSNITLDEGKYNPGYVDTNYVSSAEVERRCNSSVPSVHHRQSSHVHHHHRHNHANTGCRGTNVAAAPAGSTMYRGKFRIMVGSDPNPGRDCLTRFKSDSYTETIGLNETKSVSFEEDVAIRLPPPPLYFSQPTTYANVYDSGDEPLVLTENYRPISPPAEYAEEPATNPNTMRVRYNYQRSYSHSHEMANGKTKHTATSYNINSHKSLPDLHTQINRHSPHSEILSCCSRGNRSIKSTGESSLNRDSGGSSGHYTHRSEPCYRQYRELERDFANGSKKYCSATTRVEYRRDSGSSTQHSNTSYCDYACKNLMIDNYDSNDYLLNFTTPEVPEAFQDDYIPPANSRLQTYSRNETRYSYSSSMQPMMGSSQGYMKHKSMSDEPIVQSPGSAPSVEDISPPPIQFKRQKCIRFKNHNRISLPQPAVVANVNEHTQNSYRRSDPTRYFFPKCFSAEEYPINATKITTIHQPYAQKDIKDQLASKTPLRHSQEFESNKETSSVLIDLEQFFDRLGLQDDKFHEIYTINKRRHSADTAESDNSTVFFSDVSTVDSMRLPDSTETQPQTTQAYRPSEPPSIVERNARIIKWLCNIRKAQGDMV
uniref:Centrosome-associated FAM110 C-terminal domain-containing protein n=1 Tax=Glossina morsitans morsitans TaxID=37546 RepID=A0A1B0FBZ5_GLOMM